MKDDEAKLIAHINATPELLSLLYDLDLMPEQLKEETHQWGQMLTLTAWSAVGAMRFEPPPQSVSGQSKGSSGPPESNPCRPSANPSGFDDKTALGYLSAMGFTHREDGK